MFSGVCSATIRLRRCWWRIHPNFRARNYFLSSGAAGNSSDRSRTLLQSTSSIKAAYMLNQFQRRLRVVVVTVVAIGIQYWRTRYLLAEICSIPPAMSLGHISAVRFILRGVLLVHSWVVVWVYEQACSGLTDCTNCACSSDAFWFLVAFGASWLAWTFVPIRMLCCQYVLCRTTCCASNKVL